MFIYLHGLNSSGNSAKARWLTARVAPRDVLAPSYPAHEAARAIGQLRGVVERSLRDYAREPLVLVGSSLGGFYALTLSQHYALPIVLINPAIAPRDELMRFTGPQHDQASGARYTLTPQHLDELEQCRVKAPICGQRVLLLVDTADEVLDSAYAPRFFGDCAMQLIFEGGSHAFEHLEESLESILRFHDQAGV